MAKDYTEFIQSKAIRSDFNGFDPVWMPDFLFEFQRHLVDWAIRKGRAAIFADCGLGKTPMQLVWAENVARKTSKPVLILTPLAVANQTKREAEKFGIEAEVSTNGDALGKITIANYEKLHLFDSSDYAGVVCDESSILKSYGGTRRKLITRFMSKMSYRLLCTATAAPNDWVELGTSSEALGELSHSEMLKMFFRYLDDKGQKKETRDQEDAERMIEKAPEYYAKLAYRVAQTIGQWRLKHHAELHFWKWVASWCRACRMPSDLGFDDGDFILPPLNERDHVIKSKEPPPGMLFNIPANGLGAERDERRRTLQERCEYAASLVDHDRPAVVWCHMNAEGDTLENVIPDARQIAGKTPDNEKLEIYDAFANGDLRVLVIKPKIGAWGLNWQHCSHVVGFASHSYEQSYQAIRRCYRFGQTQSVTVDTIATEGEVRVLANLRRKSEQSNRMFAALVRQMNHANRIERENIYTGDMEVPQWL